MYHIFTALPSVPGYLGWLHFLDTMNRAAIKTDSQVPPEETKESLGDIPSQMVLWSNVSVFISVVAVAVYFPKNSELRVPFLPQPHQCLLLFVFLIMTILTGVRWNRKVAKICLSLWLRMLNPLKNINQAFIILLFRTLFCVLALFGVWLSVHSFVFLLFVLVVCIF